LRWTLLAVTVGFTFHDLRHTGITWRAVRGDEPLKIQRAAGHDDLATTQRYINEAETFEGVRFGEPFPPVALSALVGFGLSFGFLATAMANGAGFSHESLRPQGDVNGKAPDGAAAFCLEIRDSCVKTPAGTGRRSDGARSPRPR
jgi:hypothetical protein